MAYLNLKIDHSGIQFQIEAEPMSKKLLNKISGEIFKNYKVDKLIRSKDNIRIMIGNEYLIMIK